MDVVINNSVDIDRLAQIFISQTGIWIDCQTDPIDGRVRYRTYVAIVSAVCKGQIGQE